MFIEMNDLDNEGVQYKQHKNNLTIITYKS